MALGSANADPGHQTKSGLAGFDHQLPLQTPLYQVLDLIGEQRCKIRRYWNLEIIGEEGA